MFFDDSARALVSDTPNAVNFVSGSMAVRDDAEISSSRLSQRAETINTSKLKRAIDLIGAAALIVVFAPVMIMIAIAIKIESGGPVFFRQQRYGLDRKKFGLVKFRSMIVMESTGAFQQARVGDKRITRVGAFLRRSSLDELPQLFNVLKGEMSLVGPRPHAAAMDDTYDLIVRNYADRHLVRPGLTGLAQVQGFRGPTHQQAQIERRLGCDRAYIRHWSVAYDLKILLLTPVRLLNPNAF